MRVAFSFCALLSPAFHFNCLRSDLSAFLTSTFWSFSSRVKRSTGTSKKRPTSFNVRFSITVVSFRGLDRLSHSPSSSIVSSLRKISRSFTGSSLTGISKPTMVERTRISGFLPHHLPRPVKVCPRLAFLSL